MSTTRTTGLSMRRDVPPALRAHTGFTPDYVDVFTFAAPQTTSCSPEQWARAAWEGADRVGRFLAWRAALQLRLGSWSAPELISGWRIAERGTDWLRLETHSWCLTAHCLFHVSDQDLTVATMMRYDRAVASLIWGPLSTVHRAAMPGVMRNGAKLIHRSAA